MTGLILRVLLVEDDPGDAVLVRALLRDGFSIAHVTTLGQAITLARQNEFDVALVDCGLPDAQGNEAVDVLARLGQFAVILLTGTDDRVLGQAAARSGAQGYLVKGEFSPSQLEHTIFNAIHRLESLVQFKGLLTDGPDAVLLLDQGGNVLFANAAATAKFGLNQADVIGSNIGIPVTGQAIQEITLDSGSIMEMHRAPVLQYGKQAYLVMLRDVTDRILLTAELARAKQKLEDMAATDPLTGILNRRGIEAELMLCIQTSVRGSGRLAAILIDCDDFKGINERFGYRAGDATLQLVSQTVAAALRAGDRFGRIGGDEFLVLLPQTTVAEAFFVAEKIRKALAGKCLPVGNAGIDDKLTLSLGVTALTNGTSSLAEAIAMAEAALRISKRAGKNQASVTKENVALLDEATEDVRDYLQAPHTIRVFSQPIVDIRGAIVGYELLMRGPVGSHIEAPNDFFASARHCNVLGVADLVCLRRCIEAATYLPATPRVHVNLFPTTILDTPITQLLQILALPKPFQLVVEINEQEFLGNASLLRPAVAALKQAGVLIALDDVGFGHSSLETLLLLEPDIAKIDRCMVDRIADNLGQRRAFERLVTCLKSLKLEIVAEGVEPPVPI